MATIRSELKTRAAASEVWSAVRDIGALHTRLVPGFVFDTKLEPGARIVTFINGVVVREPIVTLDDEARRLVWTVEGGRASHYNAALQVSELADGLTSVVWTADFLPDDIERLSLKGDRGGHGGDAADARSSGGVSRAIDDKRRISLDRLLRETCQEDGRNRPRESLAKSRECPSGHERLSGEVLRRLAMLGGEPFEIEPDRLPVDDPPFARDHHSVRAVRAA